MVLYHARLPDLPMPEPTPFHASERHVQTRAGQLHRADNSGRMIASSIIRGAWSFLADQAMIVIGSWDGARGAWPTLVVGAPGFVTTNDGTQVVFDMAASGADPSDPLWDNLARDSRISFLAIELSTRRRLRVNGHVNPSASVSLAHNKFEVTVDQAYPNCPKYIQRRILRNDVGANSTANAPVQTGTALHADQVRLIAAADTFFVASVHPAHGTDVSHRGGNSGFVLVLSTSRLRIPDYVGNGMFNTLGNIHATGFAGLLFVDFLTGRLLQILGNAEIDWKSSADGAERSWTLDILHVRQSALPVGVDWKFVEASPFNP